MKLSIITINKNNSFGLEKTIQSVAKQTFRNYEYIVIDGASEDKSLEIIKKYSDKINFWISEGDSGIFSAMNKGIKRSSGDYCLFLNSGDWIIDKMTLQNVFDEISEVEASDIYYSDCLNSDNSVTCFPRILTMKHLMINHISHQNTIIKRELFIQHEFYDEQLKIASDWGFFLNEYWTYKSTFKYINTKIAIFSLNGISKLEYEKAFLEREMIIKTIFDGISDMIINSIKYRKNLHNAIFEDIKNRNGLGIGFILKCFKIWIIENFKWK
jgi:glycosyltransferase involved in cell wall biosynthesis